MEQQDDMGKPAADENDMSDAPPRENSDAEDDWDDAVRGLRSVFSLTNISSPRSRRASFRRNNSNIIWRSVITISPITYSPNLLATPDPYVKGNACSQGRARASFRVRLALHGPPRLPCQGWAAEAPRSERHSQGDHQVGHRHASPRDRIQGRL